MKITKHLKTAGIALLASPFLLISAPAKAGWNGQQLAIRSVASKVQVQGYNQNGQRVTWQSSSGPGTYRTSGWWWKGNVTITITFGSGQRANCNVNVPTQQPTSDWVQTDCGYVGLVR
jgi:hypothetical protein